MFGDQKDRIKAVLDKIIYTKTLEWEYEREFRLAVPADPKNDWNTLAFHPEELESLYVGAATEEGRKNDMVSLAKTINPQVKIFQARRSGPGEIIFGKLA